MYFAIRVYDDKNRQNKSRDLEILPTNENQARLVLANQRPTQQHQFIRLRKLFQTFQYESLIEF